jgi:hypothetical protein
MEMYQLLVMLYVLSNRNIIPFFLFISHNSIALYSGYFYKLTMTNNRLSIGLLMTLVVTMAVTPALSQDAFALTLVDLDISADIELVAGVDNDDLTMYFTDPAHASIGHTVTDNTWDYKIRVVGGAVLYSATNQASPPCDGSVCYTTVTLTGAESVVAADDLKIRIDYDAGGVEYVANNDNSDYTFKYPLDEVTGITTSAPTIDGMTVTWTPPTTVDNMVGQSVLFTNGDIIEIVTSDMILSTVTLPLDITTITDGAFSINGGAFVTTGTVSLVDNTDYDVSVDVIMSDNRHTGTTEPESATTFELSGLVSASTTSTPDKPKRPNLLLEYNPTEVVGTIRANNSCDEVTQPTDYEVWKRVSLDGGATWTSALYLDQTVTAEPLCANTAFSDLAVNPDEYIKYRIKAVNDAGTSVLSSARHITIEPGTPPVLTINGGSEAIHFNAQYVIPTATCTDIEDGGDISGNIIQTGSVGSVPGDYVLDYECTDSTGNTVMDSITITRNESTGGSGNNAHKTKPTFGLDWNQHTQIVEDGVTFNKVSYDVTDNFHTDFNRQHVLVGVNNVVAMKVYAPYDLKWVEFIFDVPETGAAHNAKASVFVPMTWMDTDEIDQDGVEVIQDVNLINVDKVEVYRTSVTCTADDVEENCDLIAAKVNFNEQPASGVFAFKAVDERNRSTTTYFNDGIEVTGDSLNPLETVLVSTPDRNHRGLVELKLVIDGIIYGQLKMATHTK